LVSLRAFGLLHDDESGRRFDQWERLERAAALASHTAEHHQDLVPIAAETNTANTGDLFRTAEEIAGVIGFEP